MMMTLTASSSSPASLLSVSLFISAVTSLAVAVVRSRVTSSLAVLIVAVAVPLLVAAVIAGGVSPLGLVIRSGWSHSLPLSPVRLRPRLVLGLSLLAVSLFVFLLVFGFLSFLLLLVSLLAALFLLLAAAVFLHGVFVKLEQLSGIKISEVGDEKPEIIPQVLGFILSQVSDQNIDVLPDLHE